MGCEFGQWQEWNFSKGLEWGALDSPNHAGLQRFVSDLNHLYRREPALYEDDFEWTGFEWIDANDSDGSAFSFVRKAKHSDEAIIILCNFTPVVRELYYVGVPKPGYYAEILNSDSEHYWGGNIGNSGGQYSQPVPMHGYDQSLVLRLPPLATIMLKLRAEEKSEAA